MQVCVSDGSSYHYVLFRRASSSGLPLNTCEAELLRGGNASSAQPCSAWTVTISPKEFDLHATKDLDITSSYLPSTLLIDGNMHHKRVLVVAYAQTGIAIILGFGYRR